MPNECLGGSRDDVLEYISTWIDKPNELVLWMHGAAGLGKSTVGQELVRLLKDDDRLAGGVFLTNLTTEHPGTVIQMISKQLGEMHPRAIGNISQAARKLNGPHSALRDYFTAYIVDPILKLKYPYPLVIVVDALEEWRNHESFLAELGHISSASPFKFVLTSRPSHSIERVLKKIPVQPYPLPPVSQDVIERYFNHHFKSETINWRGRKPDPQTINRLVTHAHGLLIWAATVRSLISHESDDRHPHVILDQILLSEEKVGTRSGEQLERLYHDAIATLFPEADMRKKLWDFIGAMMVLQETLSIRDFADLLGMSDRPAEEIQRRLAALQTRGHFMSNVIPPASQQFHASFLEFIQSTPTENNGQSIVTNSTDAHSMLANRCLEILFFKLLQSPRGQTCGYSELRGIEPYAVKFWPLHLSNGSPRLLLASSGTGALLDISEEGMRRWATLFLPCVSARFHDGSDLLDNIPKSALLYQLAIIIGKDDVTTLSYQLYCLEIAVRLQPMNVGTWTALGEAYNRLYEDGGYNKNLDEEISVFRHALELVSQKSACQGLLEDVDQGYILASVASAFQTRFGQEGAPNDLDEAILLHRQALNLRPASHPERCTSLNNLAIALRTCFGQRGDPHDLEEAISLHRKALELRPAPHPDRSQSLNNLAVALQTRFGQSGAPNDLDEAISFNQEALDLRPAPHPDRPESLNNLAIALQIRFGRQGAPNDLEKAISLHREALDLFPSPHPARSKSLNNLAFALQTRFNQRGALDNLEEAILLNREALVLRPTSHPDRYGSLNNLAIALQTRFDRGSFPNDLDEVISLHREALALRPAPHPDRSTSLNNLAIALQTCFGQRGALDVLEEAISFHREALKLRPASHPHRSQSLHNLANALRIRFGKKGDLNDLEKAISLHRQAIDLLPSPHPDRSSSLNNLAFALQIRFIQWGTLNDLDEAISFNREALVLRPAPHPNHFQSLNNLTNTLQTRFGKRGASNDLDEVISLRREALGLLATSHPKYSDRLKALALSLQSRFEESHLPHDLDEVILLHRQLLNCPVQDNHRPWSSEKFPAALRERHALTGEQSDLDDAIEIERMG